MRLFVGVDLPTEARHELAARLAQTHLPGSVVAPDNWHLTLRFIGGVDEAALDRLVFELSEAETAGPFPVRFAEMGAFSRPSRASVLWLGVDRGGDELSALAGAVDEAVDRAGFGQEDRPFQPHLTLSRLRPARDVRPVLASGPALPVRWVADSFALFSSHLGPGGATYRVEERFPL